MKGPNKQLNLTTTTSYWHQNLSDSLELGYSGQTVSQGKTTIS